MPAPRKPAGQRSARTRPTKDFGLVRAGGADLVPDLPAKLNGVAPLPETVAAWHRLWSAPVAKVLSLESDLEAVTRWAALLDERERAMRAFRRKRLVEGSQGQPTLNPLWTVVRGCDTEIRALEDRIGLTPKARLQLGITLAEAGKSLDELNSMLDEEDDADDDTFDPRLGAVIDL